MRQANRSHRPSGFTLIDLLVEAVGTYRDNFGLEPLPAQPFEGVEHAGMFGGQGDDMAAPLRQPPSEELEDASPVCCTSAECSANHGQFVMVGQQRGGRDLTRSPSRRYGRSCIRGGHMVSLVS